MLRPVVALLLAGLLTGAAPQAIRVAPADPQPGALVAIPVHVGGRVEAAAAGASATYLRQWPGTYFETGFQGAGAFLKIGPGAVRLHILVDGTEAAMLTKPAPGLYAVSGLAPGAHRLRVEVASESQAGPTRFNGFFAGPGTVAATLPARLRQIEFVGDSHTVGYGNLSPTRTCSEDMVWATTDTSAGMPGQVARHYDADYRVNAISGRGVVRNYGGFIADPLPVAYPYTLLDHDHRDEATGWHPQLIVVALGTNDFTTPLHAGETWATRDALHADFEASYVRFVRQIRARNPQALIVLWATDMANGEIESEVGKVAETLVAAGDKRVTHVFFDGLALSACNSHPSVADDTTIAAGIEKLADAAANWPR